MENREFTFAKKIRTTTCTYEYTRYLDDMFRNHPCRQTVGQIRFEDCSSSDEQQVLHRLQRGITLKIEV